MFQCEQKLSWPLKWMNFQKAVTLTTGLFDIAKVWEANGASRTLTTAMGRFTASKNHTAQAAIATIAPLTELWYGKMVVVSRNTANPGDGQDENTTLVQDTSIHLMLVHALATPAAHTITHLAVLVTRDLQLVVQRIQVQWLIAIV